MVTPVLNSLSAEPSPRFRCRCPLGRSNPWYSIALAPPSPSAVDQAQTGDRSAGGSPSLSLGRPLWLDCSTVGSACGSDIKLRLLGGGSGAVPGISDTGGSGEPGLAPGGARRSSPSDTRFGDNSVAMFRIGQRAKELSSGRRLTEGRGAAIGRRTRPGRRLGSLRSDGTASFDDACHDLMVRIDEQCRTLT